MQESEGARVKTWGRLVVVVAGAAALASAAPAMAQEAPYPKANIDMTVLFPAGTSADVTARVLADRAGGDRVDIAAVGALDDLGCGVGECGRQRLGKSG